MNITNGTFWKITAERSIKTASQTAAALIGTAAVGILDLDWSQIWQVAATAAVLSILTSLASDRIGSVPGPSLVADGPTPAPQAPTAVVVPEVDPEPTEVPEPVTPPVVTSLPTGGVRNDIAAATDPANIIAGWAAE